MKRLVRSAAAALLALAVLTAGCNVYEGLYEEGQSEDPQMLLEDARIALQQDRPEEAVEHLRKALDLTEDDALLRKQVQVKLASAVLQVHAINVLSLRRIVRTFAGTASGGAGKAQGQTCLFPPTHAREPFDPTEGIDVAQLGSEASAAALAESRALIAEVFSGAFPCNAAVLDQDVAALQAQGLPDEAIAEALVDYAVALTTVAYLDVIEAGGDDAAFFYATAPSGEAYVGLCFSSEATCTGTVDRVKGNLGHFDCGTRILRKRAEVLGSTNAADLADLARDGYNHMAAGLQNATCIVY